MKWQYKIIKLFWKRSKKWEAWVGNGQKGGEVSTMPLNLDCEICETCPFYRNKISYKTTKSIPTDTRRISLQDGKTVNKILKNKMGWMSVRRE